MQRFRRGRCSEVVTAKIMPIQRDFLEKQALTRDVSICSIIRELIDQEMTKTEERQNPSNGMVGFSDE